MNTSRVTKLIAISVVLLSVTFLVVYRQLGGFKPVITELVQVKNYQLVGRHFQGSFRSDSIRIYFNEMRSMVKQGELTGQPVIIYDQEPEGARGFSKSFIGILLGDDDVPPSYLERRTITASKAIRVSKDAHISVMPKPDKIARKIENYCRQYDMEAMGPEIEIYHPNNRLVIELPVY